MPVSERQPELKASIEKFLKEMAQSTKDLSTLISWGFRLVDYHQKPDAQGVGRGS